MAPAPIAITVSTRPKVEPRPNDSTMGAISADVATSATVEEPCAVLKAAATRNGRNIPIL